MTIAPDVWVMGSGITIGLLLGHVIRMVRCLFFTPKWDLNAEIERIKNEKD